MAKQRRKVRWGRVFVLLLVLAAMVALLAGTAIYAYQHIAQPTAAAEPQTAKALPPAPDKQINILLLGLDDGDVENPDEPRRSDAMLVASINKENGSVHLISIPRDTKVTIPGQKTSDKITHAFYYGGADLSRRTVEDFMRIPIHHYVAIDWQAFIKIVDALGGIDLYVENDMDYEDPYADLYIHLNKGYQHLDGKKAGEYVRFRHDELGDIGRVQRQQRFLKALDNEVLQVGTLFKIPELLHVVETYVKTDITLWTTVKVAYSLKHFTMDKLHTEMVPGDFATIEGVSYWVYDKEETKQMVERMLEKSPDAVSGLFDAHTRKN